MAGALTFEPLLMPGLWVAIAVLSAGMLVLYGWRRPPAVSQRRWRIVLVLMSLAVALVLALLLNPMWEEAIPPPPGKPELTILVDRSESMATPDAMRGLTRFTAARELAKQLNRHLEHRFVVNVSTFAEALMPASMTELANASPEGMRTDLATAITDSLKQQAGPGQAIVLLSDGVHNGMGGHEPLLQAAQLARAMAAPIYTRTIGTQARAMDLEIQVHAPQQLAYIRQQVPLIAHVSHQGMRGTTASVSLLADGQVIDNQQVTLVDNEPVEARFHVSKAERGMYHYVVRVDPMPGEATQANNEATSLLHVVDEPIRVLLLEGKPYWDTKFLMRTLASDPAIALDSVVQLGPDRILRRTLSRTVIASAHQQAVEGEGGATLVEAPKAGSDDVQQRTERWHIIHDPTEVLSDLTALNSYQVVVLGRDTEPFLTEAGVANLREWLAREGGSLVCYRGMPTSRITEDFARLLPVRWTPATAARFRVHLTERGRKLRWFPAASQYPDELILSGLPGLESATPPAKARPLAVVLAETQGQQGEGNVPVLTYQPYGIGRSVVVEGGGMWRWAFLAPEYQEYDDTYASLWQSLLRWLVSTQNLRPGQQVTLRPDKVSFNTAEPATASLLIRTEVLGTEPPPLELTGDMLQQPERYTPVPIGEEVGVYRIAFGRLPAGKYTATLIGDFNEESTTEIVFDVRDFTEETLNLRSRPDLMTRVAEASGGADIAGDLTSDIAREFDAHIAKIHPPRLKRRSAWDRKWVLAAVVVAWCVSWGLRRSGGLI